MKNDDTHRVRETIRTAVHWLMIAMSLWSILAIMVILGYLGLIWIVALTWNFGP